MGILGKTCIIFNAMVEQRRLKNERERNKHKGKVMEKKNKLISEGALDVVWKWRGLSTTAGSIWARMSGSATFTAEELCSAFLLCNRGFLIIWTCSWFPIDSESTKLSNEGRDQKVSKFHLLPVIFLLKFVSFIFGKVLAAPAPNLLDSPKKRFFRSPGSSCSMLIWEANVSSGHIRSTVDGKGNTVGNFLVPT